MFSLVQFGYAHQLPRCPHPRLCDLLAESIPHLVWTCTPDGACDYLSARWMEYTGTVLHQNLGSGWLRCLHPDDVPATVRIWEQALATATKYEAEFRLRRADGEYRWHLARAMPVTGPSGEVRKWFGTCTDIEDQKRAEHALRESEQQFRTLANSIPQLAWMANPDGWIFWYNRRWYEYTGTSPEQMEGWGWESVHDPAVLPRVLEQWRASIETGEPCEMVFPLRGADGKFRAFLTRVVPIRDADHKVIRWFGTNTDISAQYEAEEALRESEERFRQLAESISDIFWITELRPTPHIVYISPAYQRLWGLDPRQLYEDRSCWLGMIHPDDSERLEQDFRNAASGQVCESEYRVRLPDGSLRWVHDRGFPVFDAEGQIHRVAGIAQDVTQRKQAEAALRNSEKLAATGRLAATIAHEINNPLEAVMNLLYLLGGNTHLSDSERKFLHMAEDELARVAHIAKQTLSFYRESSATVHIDVPQLIDGVIAMYAGRLESRDIKVVRRYSARAHVQAIPGELRQVIANLIANSIDALSDGGELHVRVALRGDARNPASRAVRVTVADKGSGIPRHVQEQLFQPFFTTKKDVGTGLGLWVSRQILEKHGGSIRLRSKPGKGTVFSIHLPEALETSLPGHAAAGQPVLRAS